MEWKAAPKLSGSRQRTLIENIGLALLIWAALLILTLFEIFPHYPHTKLGWVIFIGLGPIAYLVGTIFFEGGAELLKGLRPPLRIAIMSAVILCLIAGYLWSIHRSIITGQ